ncbi:gamma-tubulin complex component 3 homolog [Tubulanus polymorphus]|uniref:gamma-tubulin complex component 3 homolog n=1 Tax=Tubulanus polymorphus TaxID=672921 RepID=UPI003DA3FAE1
MTLNDSTTPNLLVYKLCSRILGVNNEDALTPHFQFALRILGSNFCTSLDAQDAFQVSEKIKRKLVRKGRSKDAAIFSELNRKLESLDILRNRAGVLYLLMSLCDDKSADNKSSASFSSTLPSFILPQTPFLPVTSTPFNPAQIAATPRLPVSATPGAMPPQTPGVGFVTSSTLTKSSGFSSLHQTDPTPASFHPSSNLGGAGYHSDGATNYGSVQRYLPTPSIGDTIHNDRRGSSSSSTSSRSVRQIRDNTSMELPQNLLLRDIIFILQGIEGQYIKIDLAKDGYKIESKVGIPKSLRVSMLKLVECGWLHDKVRKYTDSRVAEKTFGLVGQSFCAALQQELTEYYNLIAVFDAQLQQDQDIGIVQDGCHLTIRRLRIWLLEPLVRLKTLAALVDICKGKKGGALASAVYSYTQHGDYDIRNMIKHTLTLVVQPIFATLTRWIYDGELDDQFQEFFVASDPSVREDRLWHDKYGLRKSMIPSFIQMEQARKILLIGKSINFLRAVCRDREQVKNRDVVKRSEAKNVDAIFNQDLNHTFQNMVDMVYKETSSHLLTVLHSKYKFMDHLKAMRRYLLLGQGDFIRHLMDLLEEDLAKPAASLYLHNLTGILETAIRATNAQFDDGDILKRLDVRLLEVSPGDTGWDVFSLDYHVDGPISTVFTPECMIMYLRVFNFLWRAKRMEYILAGVWTGQMSNSRFLRLLPEMAPVLHQCHMITSEMVHFIQQVQYYINFEVLECSWDELLKNVNEAEDLDYIIAAHQVFLDTIINRSLLDEKSRTILTQLRAIFDLIIQFQQIQDEMYLSGQNELDAREHYQHTMKINTEQGQWGVTEDEEQIEQQRRLDFIQAVVYSTRARLRVLGQTYQDMVQQFLLMLNRHNDVSLRFLSFRQDFNEYYKQKEPRIRTSLTYSQSGRPVV